MAGVSYWRFYFRLFPGWIKRPQIVEFLKALVATIGRKVLIIWDRLQAHRSILVLPAYARELNPVECIWGYLKLHAMPNFCARDLTHLKRYANSRLRSMQRRSTLVTAFWRQADAFLSRHPFSEFSIGADMNRLCLYDSVSLGHASGRLIGKAGWPSRPKHDEFRTCKGPASPSLGWKSFRFPLHGKCAAFVHRL
jgi:hypothetical protein